MGHAARVGEVRNSHRVSSEIPQQSVLKNPKCMFLPQSEGPSFVPIQHNWKNYCFIFVKL